MKITVEWGIEFPTADGKGWVETFFDVDCELSPAEPDVPYLKNGDPGHPGCDRECDIQAIRLQLGCVDIDYRLWPLLGFGPKVYDQIEEKAFERASRMDEEDVDAQIDAERDRRHDERDYKDSYWKDQRTP